MQRGDVHDRLREVHREQLRPHLLHHRHREGDHEAAGAREEGVPDDVDLGQGQDVGKQRQEPAPGFGVRGGGAR